MFQSYALFPHMNVAENVGFGLEPRGRGRRPRSPQRVAEMLELVQLDGLRARAAGPALRRPAPARGAGPRAGQAAQAAAARRAAGRARPQAARGHAVRADAPPGAARRHLRRRDPRPGGGDDDGDADRRHERGRIVQVGTPHEIYERPATRFVADFIGIANILQTGDAAAGWRCGRRRSRSSRSGPTTAHAATGTDRRHRLRGRPLALSRRDRERPVMLVATTNVARAHGSAHRRGDTVWLGWSDDAGQALDEWLVGPRHPVRAR